MTGIVSNQPKRDINCLPLEYLRRYIEGFESTKEEYKRELAGNNILNYSFESTKEEYKPQRVNRCYILQQTLIEEPREFTFRINQRGMINRLKRL